jgi:hypothetical protein
MFSWHRQIIRRQAYLEVREGRNMCRQAANVAAANDQLPQLRQAAQETSPTFSLGQQPKQ